MKKISSNINQAGVRSTVFAVVLIALVFSLLSIFNISGMLTFIIIWALALLLSGLTFFWQESTPNSLEDNELESLKTRYSLVSDTIVFVDESGSILLWAGDTSAFEAPEPPSRIDEVFPLGDRQIAADSIRYCLQTGEVGSAEVHLEHANGSVQLYSMSCTADSSQGRPFVRMVFKKFNNDLIGLEKRTGNFLRRFVENLGYPALIFSGEKISFENELLRELTDAKDISAVGDIFEPSQRALALNSFRELRSDNPERVGFITKDLRTRLTQEPIETTIINGLFEEGEGLIIFKFRQETHSDSCLRLLFETTADAIFLTSIDGRIVRANPSAARLAGLEMEELIGTSFHSLFDETNREQSLRQLAWLKEGDSVHFQSRLNDQNGNTLEIDISSRLIFFDEELILNVVRDITERNRFINKLARIAKDESLEVLAGGVALDFGSILEGISGAAELAMENIEDKSEVVAYLDVITKATQRAKSLTGGLSSYARKGRLEFELSDMNEIIQNSVAGVVLKDNVRLRMDLNGEIGAIVADPIQLGQVVYSLIQNAQEAMPEGGEILISTRNFSADERFVRDNPGASPGANVELMVVDSGKGINSAVLPRIFDPFYTTKERAEGTGLGLAITHSIISSHGGFISLQSEIDKGTSVRILLPIVESHTDLADRIQETGLHIRINKRIMIVDDEKIIQDVLSSILLQLGCEPINASSGPEAIEYLLSEEGVVDAILLDMVMPGLSGLETFNKIREYWPEIPVIIITGYTDELETVKMLESGPDGFIEKPFKASQIAGKLSEIFEVSLG